MADLTPDEFRARAQRLADEQAAAHDRLEAAIPQARRPFRVISQYVERPDAASGVLPGWFASAVPLDATGEVLAFVGPAATEDQARRGCAEVAIFSGDMAGEPVRLITAVRS